MKRMSFILLFSFVHISLFAQWTQVKNIEVVFKIKNFGRYVYGTFARTEPNIFFDENNLEKSSFQGNALVNYINTKNEKRDLHLNEKQDFFYSIKYPRITLNSILIKKNNSNEYLVEWNLTMKGVSKKIESIVNAIYENETLILKTHLDINRRKWDVGENSFILSDYVSVDISLILKK